jgi:uncharacterized protein
VGLRERRAALAPALAFGMAAPSLNVATIVFIGVALGWRLAALRVVLALVGVLGVSLLAARVARKQAAVVPVRLHAELDAAVSQTTGVAGWLRRWAEACLRLAIVLVPIYIVVVLLLGFARAWLFPLVGIAGWGNGLLALALLALAGTLFVIPTAGEVPIVQALLAAGLAIGPAAALLITLPIVSLPALAMLRTAVPTRALVTVVGGIWLLGIVAGLFATAVL